METRECPLDWCAILDKEGKVTGELVTCSKERREKKKEEERELGPFRFFAFAYFYHYPYPHDHMSPNYRRPRASPLSLTLSVCDISQYTVAAGLDNASSMKSV